MDLFDFAGQAFRSRLRGELARWRDEGLIDEATASRIAARYAGEEPGVSVTALAVYILGAMLIGGGVISLVAWNWHALSTGARLGLAMAATVIAQWFAHRATLRGRHGLGQALLLLGSLLFGAALFVVARHFRQGIDWPSSLLLWTLGTAAAGLCYASAPNAIFALLLSVVWTGVEAGRGAHWITLVPLLQVAAFAPLATRSRSGPLYFAGALAIGITIGVASVPEQHSPGAVVASVLAWCLLLLSIALVRPREELLSRTSSAAALILAGIPIYTASFHDPAGALTVWPDEGQRFAFGWLWVVLPSAIAATALLVKARRRPLERPAALVAWFAIAVVIVALCLPKSRYVVATAANLGLVATAVTGVASSMRQLRRGPFWLGTLTLGVLIVSRFFEYQSNLLMKAVAFLLAGALALWAGARFERRMEREERGDRADGGVRS